MTNMTVSRRGFLKSAAVATTSLVIGFQFGTRQALAATGAKMNAFLYIEPDDTIRVMVGYAEMGQGISTSIPMTIAEELEVDWTKISFELAPNDKDLVNPLFTFQATGGSTTTRGSFDPLRKAGAAARAMLEQAAAKRWGVDASAVQAENGTIVNTATGDVLSYGALAADAASETPPDDIALKDPSDWSFIGTSQDRLDIPAKVAGKARYGVDINLPGMKVATLHQCPVYGGTLKSVDPAPALAVRGVEQVVELDDAVAVVANGFWPAKKGLDALSPVWDAGDFADGDTDTLLAGFAKTLDDDGSVAETTGDIKAGFGSAAQTIEADYAVPYLAHATMEPMNMTASVTEGGVTITGPTQSPGPLSEAIAKTLGVDASTVTVQPTFLGGGFGRRYEFDTATHAALISKEVGAPVKLIVSREEDIGHDFYRPGSVSRMRVGLDDKGMPAAWETRIACSSINARLFPFMIKDGLDETSVEGAVKLAYALPNHETNYRLQPSPIPVGNWRSVGNSQNGFFIESMIDEAAHAAGVDPYEYRLSLLADSPDHAAVLKAAAEAANWGQAPEGHSQGIAIVDSFGTIVAEVVELSVSDDKEITIHNITVAADTGIVVDPRNLEGQLQSAIVFGLTAAQYGKIDVAQGRAVQQNFDSYEMVQLAQLPDITTKLVPSGRAMGGAGEPGTPPLAPALTNALFAATGQRVRSLPLMDHGYTLGSTWSA